jgi:hypothetical protein
MVLLEIKKLLHSKGNSHQTEESLQNGKKICDSYTSDKGLITTAYRELKNSTLNESTTH